MIVAASENNATPSPRGEPATPFFAPTPDALIFSDMSSHAVRLWSALRRHGSTVADCFPSHKRLATMCRLSVATVRRAINELVESGWVKRFRRHDTSMGGRNMSCGYEVLNQPVPPVPEDEESLPAESTRRERGVSLTGEQGDAPPVDALNESHNEAEPQEKPTSSIFLARFTRAASELGLVEEVDIGYDGLDTEWHGAAGLGRVRPGVARQGEAGAEWLGLVGQGRASRGTAGEATNEGVEAMTDQATLFSDDADQAYRSEAVHRHRGGEQRDGLIDASFEGWWKRYPTTGGRRGSKQVARVAFQDVLKRGLTTSDLDRRLDHFLLARRMYEDQFRQAAPLMNAATFLRSKGDYFAEMWDEEDVLGYWPSPDKLRKGETAKQRSARLRAEREAAKEAGSPRGVAL